MTGDPEGSRRGGGIARRDDHAPIARAAGRTAGLVVREFRNAPARGWLLAERVAAVAARVSDSGSAMADVLVAVWELAENSEATVRHVVNGPLGQERTDMTISPAAVRADLEGRRRPGEESETHVGAGRDGRNGSGESTVVLQTGGMLTSDEAILVEIEVPERRLERVLTRLEAAGVATEELRRQLAGLPAHALPLRPGHGPRR